jgi:DNA (cytosine-5)-methyltransferase 1
MPFIQLDLNSQEMITNAYAMVTHQHPINGMATPAVTISEASQYLGTSIDTIRRWEKKGLIKASRSTSGNRLFSIPEIERLKNKISSPIPHQFRTLTATDKSTLRVVELFAGAGGLALGLENAGLQKTLLVEIDPRAAATLKKNRPDWKIRCEDVAKIDFTVGQAEILTGGFPCQAFSYAGKKLGFEDTRGTLFFEFARAAKEIQPTVILGENVRGLERHDEGRTLQTMLSILSDLGYEVSYRILRAQYMDVPQKRERLVIIGVKKGLYLPIYFPKEWDYTVSLRDALRGVAASDGQRYTPHKKAVMELVPEGGYWRDLPLPIQKSYMGASFHLGGGKTGMARRLSWDEPSLTLTCNPAQKQTERCHPTETRPLTVREYARLQTFPDEWEFTGSTAAQYRQIGNAVPVNLAFHIGRCLRAMLEGTFDPATMVLGQKRI